MLSLRARLFFLLSPVLLLAALSTTAQSQVYFGQDLNPDGGVVRTPPRLLSHPKSDAARNAFLARLSGVATESFESYANGSTPPTLNFGPDTATLTGNATISTLATGTFFGAYPTSGNNFVLESLLVAQPFKITFSTPQAAFGFYGTDIGDGGDQLSLSFLHSDGSSVTVRTVPNNTTLTSSGAVLYYGVIDTVNPFVSVTFSNSANDTFGFDDMTIGRLTNVPEPGMTLTFAAFACTLLGWTLYMRRRSCRVS